MNASVTSAERTCSNGMGMFVAKPDSDGRHPVVILIHERYGLVTHTRDLARRCASDGFLVAAPNLFFRHPDQKTLNKGDSRYDLSDPEAVELLTEAMSEIADEAGADMSCVAVAGYCQTGRHPLVFAAEFPVQAAVVWYGAASKREWLVNVRQPKPLDEVIARVPCPVFGAFGSDDHIISIDDVRRFRDALETHGKSYDIHVLAGAPHGWLNDTMPGRYRKKQADAAWASQQRFLRDVFDGKWSGDTKWRFTCDVPADYDFSKNVRQE